MPDWVLKTGGKCPVLPKAVWAVRISIPPLVAMIRFPYSQPIYYVKLCNAFTNITPENRVKSPQCFFSAMFFPAVFFSGVFFSPQGFYIRSVSSPQCFFPAGFFIRSVFSPQCFSLPSVFFAVFFLRSVFPRSVFFSSVFFLRSVFSPQCFFPATFYLRSISSIHFSLPLFPPLFLVILFVSTCL